MASLGVACSSISQVQHCTLRKTARNSKATSLPVIRCMQREEESTSSGRRSMLLQGAGLLSLVWTAPAMAIQAGVEDSGKRLCDDECAAKIEDKELVSLPSGLKYRDVVVGTGPNPPIGFQVVCNYVAYTTSPSGMQTGRVFDNSLEKFPYDIRVGSGQVIPGLDEGLLSMQVGGIRRLYIPGSLAFPKGLSSAAGRPRVPPASPVIFDVQLLYIPGLDLEE